MGIYIAGMFLSLLFSAAAVNLSKNEGYYFEVYQARSGVPARISAALSCAVPMLIAALRGRGVGTDLEMYRQVFASRSPLFSDKAEYLFTLLMDMVHIVSDDPQVFVGAASLMIYGVYFFAIYKNSEDPPYSVLLFFLTMEYFRSLNGIRQYMAAVILLLALPALEDRRWGRTVPIIAAASFIHKSSAVFGLMVLLCQLRPSPLVLLAGLGAAALGAASVKAVLFYFLRKYTVYSGYFSPASRYSQSHFSLGSLLVYAAFFAVLCYLYGCRRAELGGKLRVLLNAVSLGIFFCILTAVLPNNTVRLKWYVDALIVIYAPSMVRELRPELLGAFIRWAVMAGYLAMCILDIVLRGHHDVLPYRTFWQ